MAGIPTPTLFYVDQEKNALIMEHFVHAITVRDFILSHPNWEESRDVRELAINIGAMLAKLHKENIIHGDLTTSNMLLADPSDIASLTLIDFGLSHHENVAEHKGVDLYVLERAFLSTHPNTEKLFEILLKSYEANGNKKTVGEVIAKLEEVRLRGRKRTMIG